MFLGGDYHDRDNPHRITQPPSNRNSSIGSWMQSESDVGTSSSSSKDDDDEDDEDDDDCFLRRI
jgi:hypothetical protein